MTETEQSAYIRSLARPHVLALKPYSSARDEYTGEEGIFLDANENPFMAVTGDPLNRYPDPYQRKLKAAISKVKGVPPDCIFLGNGSDEPIDLLFRAFCDPEKDRALLMPPTYGMYAVSAAINQTQVLEVPLTPTFEIDAEAVLSQLNPDVKLVFVCSPNNPTGNLLSAKTIEQLLEKAEGLVVVDEAYIDFAEAESWSMRLKDFPNLVVLQTFSKAWGMAGLRLGMAFAHPAAVQLMNKIKAPYNLNLLTQQKALQAIGEVKKKHDMVKEILTEREQLKQQLGGLSLVHKIFPSDSNSLLIRVTDARAVYEYLAQQLIIVRDRSNVTLCEGCLRITVGTPEENRKLIGALTTYGA